jgi:hypothetical protein
MDVIAESGTYSSVDMWHMVKVQCTIHSWSFNSVTNGRKRSAFDPAEFKMKNSEPKAGTIPLDSTSLYDRPSAIHHSLFPSQLRIEGKGNMWDRVEFNYTVTVGH